jgi:hemin uptake protein HemP
MKPQESVARLFQRPFKQLRWLVVGDDGEKYELRKTFFGKEKIVTV